MIYVYLIERAVDICVVIIKEKQPLLCYARLGCKINLSCFDSIVMYIS